MEYDFNIVVKPHTEDKEIHSFTIDDNGGVYKGWGTGKSYLLSWEECRLICNAGGVNKIWLFLKQSNYTDRLCVAGLEVVNLNP